MLYGRFIDLVRARHSALRKCTELTLHAPCMPLRVKAVVSMTSFNIRDYGKQGERTGELLFDILMVHRLSGNYPQGIPSDLRALLTFVVGCIRCRIQPKGNRGKVLAD